MRGGAEADSEALGQSSTTAPTSSCTGHGQGGIRNPCPRCGWLTKDRREAWRAHLGAFVLFNSLLALERFFSRLVPHGVQRSQTWASKKPDLRSGQVRFITRPKSRTMRATRQRMLPPSTVVVS
jgi:hypothetical protein